MPEFQTLKDDYDRTGDSGLGTGSCSADCDGREQWKQAMTSPPPGEVSYVLCHNNCYAVVFSY